MDSPSCSAREHESARRRATSRSRSKRFQQPVTATGDMHATLHNVSETTDAPRPRPTIYDVARLAGVSTATVSRALNGSGHIAPATRNAIAAAVAQLGYSPNTIARSLVTNTTQTIALLLPDITNPFY